MSRTLAELLHGLAIPLPPRTLQIGGISADSRRVQPGNLFLALRGSRGDTLRHVSEACAAGAAAVLVESEADMLRSAWPVPVIPVPALRPLMGTIAARWHGDPSASLAIAGITGTNGKSSVAQLVVHAAHASAALGPSASIGTLGNGFPGELAATQMTTPDALTMQSLLADFLAAGARSAVLEVSSHGLDQWRVDAVHFKVAVFTNLTRDHLDYHGDMDRYGAAKRRLFEFEGLQSAVVNLDDPFAAEIVAACRPDVDQIGYSLGDAGRASTRPADLQAEAISASHEGIAVRGHFRGRPWSIRSPLMGRFNASNLLAALGTLVALDMPLEQAASALEGVPPIAGRMERIAGPAGSPAVVIDYAHTPDGLRNALSVLRGLTRGRLWCVFGCGGDRDPGKRPLMGAVAEELADRVVLTSDNPRSEEPRAIIAAVLAGMGAPDAALVEPDRAKAIALALRSAAPDDLVLVAGKGHEDYQEIGGVRRPYSDHAVVRSLLGTQT